MAIRRETNRSPKAHPPRSVRELLLQPGHGFSKAEMMVVRQLLANYPAAGLTTVSKLAQLSGVSDPTVLRVAVRLGFGGFAGLQQALLAEVEAHMRSPLTLAPVTVARRAPEDAGNVYHDYGTSIRALVDAARHETPATDYERAVAILADRRLKVAFLGGRFSRFLAGLMQRTVNHMRDNTQLVDGNRADQLDELAAFDHRHVLVVFDFRRYQSDVVEFAEQARDRGATVILFTDRWRSPIAPLAEVVLAVPTETNSPFDTLVTPLLQVETVIAGLAERLGGDWLARAAELEQVRSANHVTLAGSDALSRATVQKKRKTANDRKA